MRRETSSSAGRTRTVATVALWTNILAGLIQIILGVLLWSGRAHSLLAFHMMLGMLFVLALWTLAFLSRRADIAWRWILFAVAWGVFVAGFGGMQSALLPGSLHWLVKVIHLLLGIVAMAMATMFGRAIRHGFGRST